MCFSTRHRCDVLTTVSKAKKKKQSNQVKREEKHHQLSTSVAAVYNARTKKNKYLLDELIDITF
jgi:hypothetical protein